MKKNNKDPKKRGIISVVQSPDEGKTKNEAKPTASALDNLDKQANDPGIISIVQAPAPKKVEN